MNHPRNPRLVAAGCYVVPFLVAGAALLFERRNRFVRYHAIQALLFFTTLVLAQMALFALLVAAGNVVTVLWAAAALGILFWILFPALGLLALIVLLRLFTDALAGRPSRVAYLSYWAGRLEQRRWRARPTSTPFPAKKNRVV